MSALAVAATGSVAASAVGLVLQAADSGSDLAPWLTGAGPVTLGALLAYLLKQFLAGNIVSRPIAERLQEQATMLAAMAEREDKVMALAIDCGRREAAYSKKMEDANRALWRVGDLLSDHPQPRRKP